MSAPHSFAKSRKPSGNPPRRDGTKAEDGTSKDAGAPDSLEAPLSHPWVPNPMQLAHLAALIYPTECRDYTADEALQKAWTLFAHSNTFCSKLRKMSVQQIFLLYGTTPGITHTSSVIRNILSFAPVAGSLRFYPEGKASDKVSEFLGSKSPRTVFSRIKKYCDANKDEDGESTYKSLLKETKKTDQSGEIYHELPIELLDKIRAHGKRVKSDGGKRIYQPPSQVLREIVSDV
jgi:hypothetical protein